jgi:hypothetical protein
VTGPVVVERVVLIQSHSWTAGHKEITYKKCGGVYIPFDNAEYFHNPTPF